jgi:FlaA1/EpsC-like NDP-sugar epimerase
VRINIVQNNRGRNMNGIKGKLTIAHWKVIAIYLMIFDVVAINFSYFFALFMRFEFSYKSIPQEYFMAYLKFAPIYTVFTIVIFYVLRLYSSLWRFASFNELNRVVGASAITTVFHWIGITVLFSRMPMSYYITGPIIQFCLVTAVRFSYRYITMERQRRELRDNIKHNAMIIGAGAAGQVILRELKNSNESQTRVCCMIDDNPNKWGRYMDGIPVVGGRDSIFESVDKYGIDKILVALPAAGNEQRREILNICKETGCEIKSLPGIYQLTNGEVSLSKMKKVDVVDLLGREPIKVNMDEICTYIEGKVVLVTGGGGSIGSELCRQVAKHHPKQLVIFDIYENNAYDIEQELRKNCPDLNLVVLIGSVRDSRRIEGVFEKYRPQIVYHAAAHKHVPLMENSPNEAIKNNVIGTYKTALAAMKYGTERFVLISTDKAVNPTNIMGASKRLCEMVIQSMNVICRDGRTDILPKLYAHTDDDEAYRSVLKMTAAASEVTTTKEQPLEAGKKYITQYAAVRFGNVLGSNGSVIPLFKKQIEAGGPVTVTHPDIIRYFMTIPEAVSLVLQAGVYAQGGDIFVLDMGEPVKIDLLARNLIKLSGYTPDVDIKIVYSGLRPGEKLYEEKLMAEEGLQKTQNDLIHIGKPIPFNIEEFMKQLEMLAEVSYNNTENIEEIVAGVVKTYHPDNKK